MVLASLKASSYCLPSDDSNWGSLQPKFSHLCPVLWWVGITVLDQYCFDNEHSLSYLLWKIYYVVKERLTATVLPSVIRK